MKIVQRTIWGYAPDDPPPKRYWVWDDDEYHDLHEYYYDGNGHAIQYDGEHYCGLSLALKRVYEPPSIGEGVALEHVLDGHWYSEGRKIKQRTGDEPHKLRSLLVTYAGETKPLEQLALL